MPILGLKDAAISFHFFLSPFSENLNFLSPSIVAIKGLVCCRMNSSVKVTYHVPPLCSCWYLLCCIVHSRACSQSFKGTVCTEFLFPQPMSCCTRIFKHPSKVSRFLYVQRCSLLSVQFLTWLVSWLCLTVLSWSSTILRYLCLPWPWFAWLHYLSSPLVPCFRIISCFQHRLL